MKAVVLKEHGDSSKLIYEDAAKPDLKAGEVLIKIEAAGMNFIDIYHRKGLYKIELPYIMGVEGAGIVIETSPEVETLEPGDRVAYQGVSGSYAEFNKVPADRCVKLPKAISIKQAASLMLQGLTAHYLARSTFPLKKGDTCLIHAAAGGVGLLLTQIAKAEGAFVIGTVSTDEKAELAKKAGCDKIIKYTEQDFEEEVKNISEGKGIDVVYDSVGKDTFEKSINCLKPRGYMVLYGQSSGPVKSFDPQILNSKGSLFLTRPSLKHYTLTKDDLTKRAEEIFDWVIDGSLKLFNITEFPLNEAASAHRDLESRKTTGKVLLIP